MAWLLRGLIRTRLDELLCACRGELVQLSGNLRHDLRVAQSLPGLAQVAITRDVYRAQQTTAVNMVNALPTTAAMVTLWNGEPLGGRCYVVIACPSTIALSSFGGPFAWSIVGCVNSGQKADPAGTLLTIRGTSGQPYKGLGRVGLARTITNEGWFPIGHGRAGFGANMADPGYDNAWQPATAPTMGLIVLPPKHLLGISVMSAATGGLATVRSGFMWHEVYLPADFR